MPQNQISIAGERTQIVHAPTALAEMEKILFSLKIGEGVTFYPWPYGSAGFYLEKHCNGHEFYWVGGPNGSKTEYEEEEEINSLAAHIFHFVSERDSMMCSYRFPARRFDPSCDEIGDYEMFGTSNDHPDI